MPGTATSASPLVCGRQTLIDEGQTEFWGRVLAARAGLRTTQQTLGKLALDVALVANRSGREWKTLADSTLDVLYMPGHPVTWRDWQRREDYYPEGVLLGSTLTGACVNSVKTR